MVGAGGDELSRVHELVAVEHEPHGGDEVEQDPRQEVLPVAEIHARQGGDAPAASPVAPLSDEADARLKAIAGTTDGFAIAEEDLRSMLKPLPRPGSMTRQFLTW